MRLTHLIAVLGVVSCQPEQSPKPIGAATPHPSVDPSNVVSAGPPAAPPPKLCAPRWLFAVIGCSHASR